MSENKYGVLSKGDQILFVIFVFMFIFGIIMGLTGAVIKKDDNKDFMTVQNEVKVPETIDQVLHDKDSGRIYVCYDVASCVNVYDKDGNFLWAVSTPYESNGKTEFLLHEDKLYISHYNTYVYDSAEGYFIEKKDDNEVFSNISEQLEDNSGEQNNDYIYSLCRVFRMNEDGTKTAIISRPFWILVFYFPFDWIVSFIGAVGFGLIFLIENIKNGNKAGRKAESPKSTKMIKYMKITASINLGFAVIDIIGAFFGLYLMIGIMFVGIHFIVSNIIILNKTEKTSPFFALVPENDLIILNKWKAINLATFVVAFLSVVVAVMIAE